MWNELQRRLRTFIDEPNDLCLDSVSTPVPSESVRARLLAPLRIAFVTSLALTAAVLATWATLSRGPVPIEWAGAAPTELEQTRTELVVAQRPH